jgi:hypothetical protein
MCAPRTLEAAVNARAHAYIMRQDREISTKTRLVEADAKNSNPLTDPSRAPIAVGSIHNSLMVRAFWCYLLGESALHAENLRANSRCVAVFAAMT